MKTRLAPSFSPRRALVVALLAAAALAPAALPLAPQARAMAKNPDAELLHESMEKMGSNFKKLKKLAADNKLTKDALPLITQMQAAVLASKGVVPPYAEKLKGDEQASFVLGYRKKLIEALGQLLQLEVAILEGRGADAVALVKAIDATQKSGHDVYNREE